MTLRGPLRRLKGPLGPSPFFCAVILAALLGSSSRAPAPGYRAHLMGSVQDQTRAVLVGVGGEGDPTVHGIVLEAVTNDRGIYRIQNIEPGTYRVELEHPGFKKFAQEPTLRVDDVVRLDVQLQLGETSDSERGSHAKGVAHG